MPRRTLKRNRPTVGVLVGWQAYEGTLNSFISPLFRGLQTAARERGCNLLLAGGVGHRGDYSPGDIHPAWPVPMPDADFVPVGPWNTDGLIVLAPLRSEARSQYLQQLAGEGHPIVFVASGENGPTITVDNEGGVYQAIAHLVEHGHRRIAFIAGFSAHFSDSDYRLAAYQTAVRDYGLEADPRLVANGGYNVSGGHAAMTEILDSGAPFTAVLAFNDEAAIGAMQALRERGIKIPAEVAVIGFDNRLEAPAQIPPLTSVQQPLIEMGRQALELLLNYIEGRADPPALIRVPTRLAIRQSCGCRPGVSALPGPSPVTASPRLNQSGASPQLNQSGASPQLNQSGASPQLNQSGASPQLNQSGASPQLNQSGASPANLAREVARALCPALPANEKQQRNLDEVDAVGERLANAFLAGVAGGDSIHFHTVLIEVLQQIDWTDSDAYNWQAAISVLQQSLPSAAGTPETDNLLHQARAIISESAQWRYSRYVARQVEMTDQLGRMSARLHTAFDESQIFEILAEVLPGFGIQHAQIAFFESEAEEATAWSRLRTLVGPKESEVSRLRPTSGDVGLRTATPKSGDFPTSGDVGVRRFLSRAFPPDDLYPADQPFQLALLPLNIQPDLSGYMVFDAETLGPCAAIVRQVESSLRSARLYQAAAEGRRLAEEANRLKSGFLSMVSHELRTPLNLIAGLSEMLMREPAPDRPYLPEAYRQDIKRIHASAQHLGWLIRDVLDLASSEAGQLRLSCERLEVSEELRAVAEVGEQLARERGLAWQTKIPPALPFIWGDRARLRQVILNLISNAVKFTARGQVSLSVAAGEGHVKIAVTDTGLGIPAEEQAQIFNEFHQSERTRSRSYGGMGLGLAICKRLIELHGGVIGVQSSGAEGEGSTFYLRLPVWLPANPAAPPAEPAAGHSQTVLVLSEHESAAQRLRDYLIRQGFEVDMLLVQTPTDLAARLAQTPPGAVVLDLGLASERGWEVLRTLKSSPATQGVPVLFYSLTLEHGIGSMLEMDYLTKPVGLVELAQALARQGLLTGGEEKTILIVDDEPGILEMTARMVQAQSTAYRVLKARSGREALDLLTQRPVDLVLLDLMMPELDGFGVLERMREAEATRDTPVIVLTAKLLTEVDMVRLNRGVATVLEKGLFSVAETLAHIEEVLALNRKLGSEAQRLVRKAMAYLHEHYAEPLTREKIARYVGVSEDYLTHCFQHELRMPPITYLTRYRLNQAKALLADGALSVAEVAEAIGFSSEVYFSRVFKREVGVAPGAYRRGQRP